jgi:hypothetical protein
MKSTNCVIKCRYTLWVITSHFYNKILHVDAGLTTVSHEDIYTNQDNF